MKNRRLKNVLGSTLLVITGITGANASAQLRFPVSQAPVNAPNRASAVTSTSTSTTNNTAPTINPAVNSIGQPQTNSGNRANQSTTYTPPSDTPTINPAVRSIGQSQTNSATPANPTSIANQGVTFSQSQGNTSASSSQPYLPEVNTNLSNLVGGSEGPQFNRQTGGGGTANGSSNGSSSGTGGQTLTYNERVRAAAANSANRAPASGRRSTVYSQ